MPEIITKFPEITLQVLKSAGAVCGEGAPQQILRACPPERFCSLPGGEVCVYGLTEIGQMTQVSTSELAQVVAGLPAKAVFGLEILLVAAGAAFIAGLALGLLSKQRKK